MEKMINPIFLINKRGQLPFKWQFPKALYQPRHPVFNGIAVLMRLPEDYSL